MRVEQLVGKQEEANQRKQTVSAGQIYLILFVHAKKKHQKPFKERVCSLSVSCCQTYTKTQHYSSLAHDAMMMVMLILFFEIGKNY